MSELTKTFTELFENYSEHFSLQQFEGTSRSELMKKVPSRMHGVYTYWIKNSRKPLYIGCAGKISKGGVLGGNTIKQRIFGASTPYHFSKTSDFLLYDPTTATVPPAGYESKVPLSNLLLKVIAITNLTAPAVLEHLLLQGYINEFGSLPDANQKV